MEGFDAWHAVREVFLFWMGHCTGERYEEAIENYHNVMKYEEPDGSSYFYIGECYQKMEELEKAIPYYLKAIKIDPYHTDAYILLGTIYNQKDRLEESLYHLKKAIELDDKSAFLHQLIGEVQLKLGFY